MPNSRATLDLKTKIISPNQKIGLVNSGRDRRFYNTFKHEQVIFLELPGFSLATTDLSDKDKVKSEVQKAESIRRKQDISTISAGTQKHFIDRLTGHAIRLLTKVNVGDLVIVPGKGMYQPILYGEIATNFSQADRISTQSFGGAEIPFRKVRWTTPDTLKSQRRFLPENLDKLIRNANGISAIVRSKETEEFCNLAYESSVLGNSSRAHIYGPNYRGNDPTATVSTLRLTKYLVAAFSAHEHGELTTFGQLNIDYAIERYFAPDLLEEFKQEFNSPGEILLVCRRATLAAFIAAGFAHMTCTADLAKNIHVINSVEPNNASYNSDVQKALSLALQSLKDDVREEVKATAKDAKEKIGANTSVAVTQ